MVKLTPIFVIVVLVFVCYSLFLYMNRLYEPLDNPPSCLGPVTDEKPPSCGLGSSSNKVSDVPGCFSTVRADAYSGFLSDFMSSDYILKTQMVTPVCPNNPVGEVGSEYGKNERIVTPPDDKDVAKKDKDKDDPKKDKDVTKKDAAKTDYDPNKVKPDETKNTPSFLLGDLFNSQGTGQGAAQATGQGAAQATGQGYQGTGQGAVQATGQGAAQGTGQGGAQGTGQGGAQGSNADFKNTYMLNSPTTTVKPETSRGICPPCPACQRCPEPVVECKRVVNYNAAGASNLPVPMIADFSKF